ncbi:unnamed protein product [Lactuca saligna]|uniref:RNase H type-1 domain-containing protein n=1 Tax=Lactuca saligna TaxID=75948 RepID=A0AA35ZX09_LACSI|nr:unnamed protein product [Lactuca saligna]
MTQLRFLGRRSIVLHTLPLTHICSPLEVKQVNGLWKTKTQNMTSLCKVAKELKDKFASFQICHVEREFNTEADRCSSEPGSTSPGYVALEDFENGIKCYQNALQVDGRHYNAWYGLA